MKQTKEKLERLIDMTGVAVDQAETALFDSDGDLLGALLELQENGLIDDTGVGRWSTAGSAPSTDYRFTPAPAFSAAEPLPSGFLPKLKWFWRFLVSNRLEAYKKYDPSRQIQCPLGALIALLAIAWYVVVGTLIFGICIGWRYRFAGPQMGHRRFNSVITRIDDWAEGIRDRFADLIFKGKS